jgi:hypothetical protein
MEIDNLEFGFETVLGTGDAGATVSIYEIWLTVTYTRKTNLLGPFLDQDAGWVMVGVDTAYGYIWGATGSGWILTMEFEVIDYGYTDLDIETYETNLQDCGPPPNPPQDIVFTPQSGEFRNLIPGDIGGDTGGTPPDKDVDRYDFGYFADAYGSSSGDPNYNRLADLQGDTAGTCPDGDVDRYDFGAFADNYGRSLP